MEKKYLNEEELSNVKRIELNMLKEFDKICQKHSLIYTVAYGTLLGAVRHKGFIPWDDDIDVWMPRVDYIKFEKIYKKELDLKYFYQSHNTDGEYFHLFNKIRANDTIFKESFLGKYNIHHGLFIDIFPVDYVADHTFKFKSQYYKYHFYRTGLMAKYLDVNARYGKRRYAFKILKFVYGLFPLEFLYKNAEKFAQIYNKQPQSKAHCFAGAPRKIKNLEIFPVEYFTDIIRVPFEGIEVNIPKHYDEMLKQKYGDYMKLPPKEKQITRHDLLDFKI